MRCVCGAESELHKAPQPRLCQHVGDRRVRSLARANGLFGKVVVEHPLPYGTGVRPDRASAGWDREEFAVIRVFRTWRNSASLTFWSTDLRGRQPPVRVVS